MFEFLYPIILMTLDNKAQASRSKDCVELQNKYMIIVKLSYQNERKKKLNKYLAFVSLGNITSTT